MKHYGKTREKRNLEKNPIDHFLLEGKAHNHVERHNGSKSDDLTGQGDDIGLHPFPQNLRTHNIARFRWNHVFPDFIENLHVDPGGHRGQELSPDRESSYQKAASGLVLAHSWLFCHFPSHWKMKAQFKIAKKQRFFLAL